MSELEPEDSRVVTNSQNRAPGEPPRTGPREDEARAQAGQQTAEERRENANGGFATEGDSPEHPDRMAGTSAQEYAEEHDGEEAAEQSGSWRDQSE
jgi:hypothetical protein